MRIVLKNALPHVGVLVILLVLSLIFLWPLPIDGGTSIIGGGGDPLLELWTLSWNAHWFSGKAPSYFDGNICHPEKNSLAFADPLFSQALFFTPLFKFTGNPLLSYNLLLVISLVFSGWGTWICARYLGLSPPVSLVAAILFAFFPFRTAEIKHLHILSTQWLPFSFYFLLRFLRSERFRLVPLVLFALFSVLQILCSFYQALVWALLIGCTIVAFIFSGRLTRHKIAGLAAVALVLTAVVIPFASTCFQVSEQYGIVRSIGENMRYSARPVDYLRLPQYGLLHRTMTRTARDESPPRTGSGERQLYPGLVFTALLVCGIIASFRAERDLRCVWLLLLATAIAAVVFSFGPALAIGAGEHQRLVPLPYALLYHWIPGIKGLRVPSRLVLLLHFSGALLAGLGLQTILSGRGKMVKGTSWTVAALLSVVIFLEGVSFDLPAQELPGPGSMPPAYRDIRALPEGTVLLELPTHAAHYQFLPMYFSTFHFHPLANGRSGIIPPVTSRMHQVTDPKSKHGLGPALLDHMLETGINTVLLHRQWSNVKFNRVTLKRLGDLGDLKRIGRYDDFDTLYRLDAERGRDSDVSPLPAGPVERSGGTPIRLSAGNAFPTTLNRRVNMTVVDDELHLAERVHFRWCAHIPAGEWQLRLRAAGLRHPANQGRPCSLLVEVAGVTVIDRDDIRSQEFLSGVPFKVDRSAHYRISVLVHGPQDHQPINLILLDARLVPVSAPGQTDRNEIPYQ